MLKRTIINTLKTKLSDIWVSNYEWKDEFLDMHFSNWFYTAEDCYYIINNSAREYSNMLYFVEYYEYDKSCTNTVDLFNMYTYLFASYCIEEEPDILEIIRNIHRIKKVRHDLPLILSRLVLHEVSLNIQSFLGNLF